MPKTPIPSEAEHANINISFTPLFLSSFNTVSGGIINVVFIGDDNSKTNNNK